MRTPALATLLIVLCALGARFPASADPGRLLRERGEDAGGEDAAPGAPPDRPAEHRAAARRAQTAGPAVGAVLAAAYAATGLDRAPGRSWTRRARLAGLVPLVTLRTTRDTSWQDRQPEVGHGATLEARATWRLDRLLFEGRELQVAALEAARRRERRLLATRLIRAYFDWRRAVEAEPGRGHDSTRVAEAVAELDALTDGWFSEQLADRSRPPGPPGGAP